MIVESLAGKRIAITGATGFVGTALVERLLWAIPDVHLVLLIRNGRRTTAIDRLRKDILKNDAFDRLRERHGGAKQFEAWAGQRIQVIAGDVSGEGLGLSSEDSATLASVSTVIHSAAAVSFDSPIDSAVDINLMGPVNIAATLRSLGVSPHLVAVSTCYVAGNRRGTAPEALVSTGPFGIGIDWRREVAAARRMRADSEDRSRLPAELERFRKAAREELGAAGSPALSAKTETLRVDWVKQQLVEAGRARAASVGWPDAYAFTKALGEQALTETKGNIPVSIVRPSIIESSLAEPRPGWIRGFRMAEPVILSYARGLLSEFPGVPEGTVDVIPVDIVVAAIIAVAALGPDAAPPITQVASGSSNPLRYRVMVDNVRDWFTEHPVYDPKGQPILVPDFRFPGRGRVQKQLDRAESIISKGEKVLQVLPLRGKQAAWAGKLEAKRTELDRAKEYVELYGLYTECEAIYSVENLLSIHDSMTAEDQRDFNLDPRSVDWPEYITKTHLPSVVEHGRVKTTPGKSTTENRNTRMRRLVLDERRHLAAFDLENTLIASNVVESYSWLATRHIDNGDKMRYVMRTLKEAPSLLSMDRKDRSDFLRHFYRRYKEAPVEQIERDSTELLNYLILTKSFPAGMRRVREHRALGHRTVLITGAMSFVVEGLRPMFDEIVAAEMSVRPDGRYTGELLRVPPTGETRAQILSDYCDAEGLKLSEAVAYADSTSDLPMLEAVGFPVAVNPETRLAAIARKRGWLVEDWSKSPGAPVPFLPVAGAARSKAGVL